MMDTDVICHDECELESHSARAAPRDIRLPRE